VHFWLRARASTYFTFSTCVPRQTSPCSLAPLTVLARPIRASRRPPWPLTLVLLQALNRGSICNLRLGAAARRPPATMEAAKRQRGVAWPCGPECPGYDAWKAGGECVGGVFAHSPRLDGLRLMFMCRRKVAMCPWTVLLLAHA
jgi:hypothetical protein